MKYSVLVKRVVNVRLDGIEAGSQEGAIATADEIPFSELFNKKQTAADGPLNQPVALNADGSPIVLRHIEDGEQNACFLVDEEGNPDYARSRWFASDGTTVLDEERTCDMCGQKLPQAKN